MLPPIDPCCQSQDGVAALEPDAHGNPHCHFAGLQVVWRSNKGHVVRIPLVLSFIRFKAPESIFTEELKPEFTYAYKVNADAATTISVKNSGFSAGTVTAVDVTKSAYDQTGAYPEDEYPGVGRLNITIPPGEP